MISTHRPRRGFVPSVLDLPPRLAPSGGTMPGSDPTLILPTQVIPPGTEWPGGGAGADFGPDLPLSGPTVAADLKTTNG